ncbi:MAG: aminotransferase class IV family protein [Bacteroidales bacterium]|nr:aminotransferase class IV family protein [Bacteroidales bacterium]MBN2818468.1 aminotransferase class IV family protein [Bacteroidales bacterium]
MAKYLCSNGELFLASEPVLTATNRSFIYGDGVFETIRCRNSLPLFFEKHYQRLRRALYHLKIDFPSKYTEEYFRQEIYRLLQRNRIYNGAKVRLSVFRKEGGLYTPSQDKADFIIVADSLESEFYQLNDKGLKLGVYTENFKQQSTFSAFKTNNALLNVLAAKWKKENGFDDCLLINAEGHLIESSSSNVFFVKNNKLVTPAIETACVDGTMRRNILEIAIQNNIPVVESEKIPKDILYQADEVFLTNAVQGIVWVGAFEEKRYFHFLSSRLLNLLVEKAKSER